MGLTKIAIQRPVFMLMLILGTILMGTIGWNSMRTELNPDVSFGTVTITTVYPGAGPEEVNTLISKKVEDSVTGIANLQEVVTTSQEGVSSVALTFEIGADIEVALNEVRTKVDGIINDLPDGVLKPTISKFDSSQDPVLFLNVSSESKSASELRDLADNVLKDQFARIKGVAAVSVNGGDVREIQVRLRKDDLLRYGIGIVDVQRAIQAATINIPAGRVIQGGAEYTVRVLGEFRTVEEMQEMYLTFRDPQMPGPIKTVQLKNIADVVDGISEQRAYSKLDGQRAVTMTVQKAKDGNAVEISNLIRKGVNPSPDSLLTQLEKQHDIKFVVSLDTSTNIKESLFDLQFALFFGIALVSLVIWIFLHNLRGTLIVAIAIPMCLFATLIAYWAFGFTINNMSMLALSLAIGVLVDDAIVVIENIYRHLTLGEDPVDAAVNGRAEIGLAAIAITLADVVVFIPVAFMGGIVGQFFKPLGIGYAVAVMASLFVSFTVTPMLASRWYKKGEDWETPRGLFAQWFEGVFHKFANWYRRVLRASLNHRWFFFGGGFAVLVSVFFFIAGSFQSSLSGAMGMGMPLMVISAVIAGMIIVLTLILKKKFIVSPLIGFIGFSLLFFAAPVAGKLYKDWKKEDVFKFSFAPPSDTGIVDISVEMPPGTSLSETEAVVEHLEEIAMAHPQTHYVTSSIGQQGGGGFSAASQGTQYASITVTLREKVALLDQIMFWKKHEEEMRPASVSSAQVAGELTETVKRVPGAIVTINAQSGFGFGSAIQLALKGDDRDLLAQTAKNIRDRLRSGEIEGVINPDITTKPGKPELVAVPDRARLAENNVSTAEVGQALRMLYEGDDTVKYREGGNEYDIRVMMDLVDRDNREILNSVPVTFREGNPIYLSEVAHLEESQGLGKIDRRDRQEVITVTADLSQGYAAGSVQSKIDAWLKEVNLIPEGVEYRALGEADAQSRETVYLFGALFLGLILVYMVLASLFDNLLYPFIVQLAQPQAMIGALLALILTDKTLNIVGFIGIIALVGLVGKNAILLIDYTNTLRERGMEKYEALVESGGTRIRPIMMTTISLVAGMLPVALAIGRGSEFRETIGITIIGGAVVSTVLTLLVIPCSYSIFDDASVALGRLLRREKSE